MLSKLNVLVVGAGMYVGGRGTDGFGTVLPTLIQDQREKRIGEIFVTATAQNSIDQLRQKLRGINQLLKAEGDFRGFVSLSEALRVIPKPACAIIVVPDHLHFSITKQVMDSGVSALVVKPLTPTVEENLTLIRFAEEKNIYGAVEFHKRFDEANLLLRQKIADQKLGELCYATVEFSQRKMAQELFGEWIKKTNIFQYLGVHYVDLLYFATGFWPTRLCASGGKKNSKGIYDAIQTLIEWEHPRSQEKMTSTISTNWIDPNASSAMSDQKITVVGTKGRYQSDQKKRGVQLITDERGVEEINPYFSQIYRDASGRPVVDGYGPKSIRQFLRDVGQLLQGECTVEQLVQQRPSFQSALVSTAVVEAVNQSLEDSGDWKTIEWKKLSKYLPKT